MNTDLIRQHLRNLWILLFLVPAIYSQTRPPGEYLWYEAENMRGFTTGKLGEPILNPSYLNLSRDKAPGWGMNGPGVSAEWTQGGESEWNSAAAAADETRAELHQDLEIPREGQYAVWVRYADWARKTENFSITIAQDGAEVFRHEFGTKDVIDPHDEVSMYWGWSFAWDSASATLKKGPARLSIRRSPPRSGVATQRRPPIRGTRAAAAASRSAIPKSSPILRIEPCTR